MTSDSSQQINILKFRDDHQPLYFVAYGEKFRMQSGSEAGCVTAKEGDARASDVIKNLIRNRGTIDFIGNWAQLNNPEFKVVEFDHFKMIMRGIFFILWQPSKSTWTWTTG